ncbi:MAG: hypothetical protein JWO31_4250, partial [Phycisphaerales bacterium]|nr:hypothetical protein [Phycisphaerales bacterium]
AGLAAAALAVLPSRAADAAKPAAAAPATAEEGFTPLFNGTDLTGWTYGTKPAKVAATPPTGASAAAGTPATKPAMAASENKAGKGYQVRPGGILYSTKDDGGNLYTEKEYKDFVFRFEFKLTENANNGIGIRAPLTGDSAYQGMEIQVLDDSGSMYTKLRPAQYHGSVYDVFPAKRGSQKPVGEWNTEEIRVQGTKVTVTVNGQVITDADLSTVVDPAVLKKHPGLKNEKGHIGFLGHGAEVEFRNVRVKEL